MIVHLKAHQSPSMSLLLILLSLVAVINRVLLATAGSGQMVDVIAVKEGADLDLICPIVVQNEDMIISWTCDNEPANIRSSRIHVTEAGKLRIRSAKVGDSCNYRCEAADGFGTLSVITRVIIVEKKLIENLGRPNQTLLPEQQPIKQQTAPSELTQNQVHEKKRVDKPIAGDGQRKQLSIQQQQQLQQPADDLEVQVEPSNLELGKNQSFSLECSVTHTARLNQPQIIWLKEYIGRRPDSSQDAQDQSLVLIDGVYYHSLNWPRSITLSRKPSHDYHRASSVLVVRHSSYVHTGHYACFAGYPPYLMSANFSSSDKDPSVLSLNGHYKPLKYKVAKTHVRVDDPESELKHRQFLEAGENQEWRREKGEQNLLISLFSTNSWMRNLTAAFMFICVLLITFKFIHTSRLQLRNKKKLASPNAISPNLLEGSIAVKQPNTCDDLPQPYRLVDCRLDNSTARAANYDQEYPSEPARSTSLNLSRLSLSRSGDPTEHVYSEIGARKEDTIPVESYYKVPKTTTTTIVSTKNSE